MSFFLKGFFRRKLYICWVKLVSKIIKYKLDSSSKMRFGIFYPKDIQKIFWKTIDFVKNLEMTQTVGGGEGGPINCFFY